MRKNICFYLLVLAMSLSSNIYSQTGNKTRLNDGWKFLKGDLGGIWEAVRPYKTGDPEEVPIWEIGRAHV